MRENHKPILLEQAIEKAEQRPEKRTARPMLSAADLVKVQEIITNPAANLHITTTKKGALRVHLTEITPEGISTPAN